MKRSILVALSAVLSTPAVRLLSEAGWRKSLRWAARGSWLLLNPGAGLRVARVFSSTQMRPLLQVEPRLMFKYLYGYVAMDLSRRERAAMLIHHYGLLKERVNEDFFQAILDQQLELWQRIVGENAYRIVLSFPRTADAEGDLALFFQSNRVNIYTLSFTIGPGRIAGLSSPDAMYIARVQGWGKGFDLIRRATKDCLDVSPAMVLLAAAEAIARALGIDDMVGIGAAAQISTTSAKTPAELAKAYDDFWISASGVPLDRNMYHMALPVTGKSILSIKRDHRSRTNRKRRFKNTVKEQVCQAFHEVALSVQTVSSEAPPEYRADAQPT